MRISSTVPIAVCRRSDGQGSLCSPCPEAVDMSRALPAGLGSIPRPSEEFVPPGAMAELACAGRGRSGCSGAMDRIEALVRAAFADRDLLQRNEYADAVRTVLDLLDRGSLRVASPPAEPGGDWVVHDWVQQAVLLYFAVCDMRVMEVGPFEFHDKIPLKRGLAAARVRVVPPGTVRHGAHCEPGVVVMPGYVNLGAFVGAGTMVDTWATVGSCAQIGRDVHLSGGVGIGGVLEPPGATPVIVEDGAFVGSRAIVVEGVRVGA